MHCTTAVPAGDNLVIGTVVGDPTVVVRDIQDPANAKNLCTFDANVISPQFVSSSAVVYATPESQIVEAQLAGGPTVLLATFGGGVVNSGQFAVSPDGRSITYLDGNAWHLVGSAGNRVLTTLPAVPGRGVSPDEDDSFLSYSPDGQYIALFQTFHVGGTAATAPQALSDDELSSLIQRDEIDVLIDLMGHTGLRLPMFARKAAPIQATWLGYVGTTGLSAMTSLRWIRPRSSPDGRWIAYTFRTTSGLGGVGFYSVQANSVSNTSPPGRSGVRFLTNDLVWYVGEKACSTCFAGQPTPTGVTYIYSIAGASEITSRLASVYDAWPHVTAPGI